MSDGGDQLLVGTFRSYPRRCAKSASLDHLDQIVARLSGLAGFIADHLDDKVAPCTAATGKSVAALGEN
jgi:hypothetical protein